MSLYSLCKQAFGKCRFSYIRPNLLPFNSFYKKQKRIYRFIQADDYRIFDDGAILGKGLLLGLYKTLCLRVYRQHVGYLFNSQYVYDRFCQDSKRTDVPLMKVYPAVNHLIFNPKNKDKGHGGISICLVARKHP